MDALAARFSASLEGGSPDLELLRRAGEPDPPAAARAFALAASIPELGAAREHWVPELLRCARPGFGAESLAELARRRRDAGRPLALARAPALAGVLGSSNFLARLLLRHPERADALAGAPPAAPGADVAPEWPAIRRAKYDGLLRITARDRLGRAFPESLRELSDLADRCLVAALACSARETGAEPPALFALGKLGGRELNFSSDVDLLFVYEPPQDADAAVAQHRAVADLVRHFKRGLETPTEDGFAYRVDLDLRPEGRAGVIANPVDVAIAYYETFGVEWERQMLIRLRQLGGSREAGDAFARAILPFVYRRLIDPGVLDAVRDMKARIEDERRRAGRDIDAHLKEGPGGIRDVEFLVQSLQLFHGARHAELRTGHVLDALEALGRLGLLPEATAAALRDAYVWLRRAEHALQLAEERQTALFPREAADQFALARRMGYADAEGEAARQRLLEDWTAVRAEVRRHFEALVLRRQA
jgi:glutamate-ammonia-ligase adenylyltransferase